MTEALDALNRSLNQGDKWANMFLFYKIDEILVRSGFNEMQLRTWQIDLKLNRIATCVLLSGEPHFLKAVWTDFAIAVLHANGSRVSAVYSDGLAANATALPEIRTIERSRLVSTRRGLLQCRLEADSIRPSFRRNSDAGDGHVWQLRSAEWLSLRASRDPITEAGASYAIEHDRRWGSGLSCELLKHLFRGAVLSAGLFAFSDGHAACRIGDL